MSRTEKGTRLQGLPAKVRLQQQDSHTGSFPTIHRTGTDNRTGQYKVFFDDTLPITFNRDSGNPEFGNYLFDDAPEFSYFAGQNLMLWWLFETGTSAVGFTAAFDFGNGIPSDLALWEQDPLPPPATPLPVPNGSVTDVPYQNGSIGFPNSYSIRLDGSVGKCYVDGNTPAPAKISSNLYNIIHTGPFSITAWVKIGLGGAIASICNPILASKRDYILRVNSAGRVEFWMYDEFNVDKFAVYSAVGAVVPGVWTSIIITISEADIAGPTNISIFVNNINVTSTTVPPFGTFTGMNGPSYNPSIRLNVGLARNQADTGQEYFDGYIDDVAIFNKVLSSAEIDYIANHRQSANGVIYPTLINTKEKILRSLMATESDLFSGSMENKIITRGTLRKGISDSFISFTQGQDLRPFRDSGHLELDGLVSNSSNVPNPFYSTGSAVNIVGEGFAQPLSAKTIIEIPLVSSVASTILLENNTANSRNFPMGYWNFTSGTLEGIGSGKDFDTYNLATSIAVKQFLDEQCIATNFNIFNPLDLGSNPSLVAANQQTSVFGFPYHNKFHATSSQLYSMSEILSEPFLLEKEVLELSATFTTGGLNTLDVNCAVLNFILMNQREPFFQIEPSFQLITQNILGFESNFLTGTNITSSIRDVVGFMSFGSFYDPFLTPQEFIDFESNKYGTIDAFTSSLTSVEFNGVVRISASMQNSFASDAEGALVLKGALGTVLVLTKQESSSRNSLYIPTGRSWTNDISLVAKQQVAVSAFLNKTINLYARKTNPYLLLPTDKLVLAVQLPYHTELNQNFGGTWRINGVGPKITIGPYEGKLTLYGSLLRVGDDGNLVEYHDTLNQLLSSESIHETIG